MADDDTSIARHTLAILRKVDGCTERVAGDLHDLEVRMSSLEANLAT